MNTSYRLHLEERAEECCPALDVYQLRDTMGETSNDDLVRFINEHSDKPISPLTVEEFHDVVESQHCLYGNQALFFVSERETEPFQLFAGDIALLDCVSYDEKCSKDGGLKHLSELLSEIDGDTVITTTFVDILKVEFQIGIKVEGRFVETISSPEISLGLMKFCVT